MKRGSVAMKRSVFKQGCTPAFAFDSTHSGLPFSLPDLFPFERGRKQNKRNRKVADKMLESFFHPSKCATHTNTWARPGSEVKWP